MLFIFLGLKKRLLRGSSDYGSISESTVTMSVDSRSFLVSHETFLPLDRYASIGSVWHLVIAQVKSVWETSEGFFLFFSFLFSFFFWGVIFFS